MLYLKYLMYSGRHGICPMGAASCLRQCYSLHGILTRTKMIRSPTYRTNKMLSNGDPGVSMDQTDSNSKEFITAPPEMLEKTVEELLRRIPATWQEYQPDNLSAAQSQGLFLLVAAGMVERRDHFRLRMHNHDTVAEATITLTGEYGLAQAVEPLLANLWADWQDAFRQWRQSDTADSPAAHFEHLSPREWRLTDQGELARQDLDADPPKRKTLFDFVLKRGFYDRPRLMPDGRLSGGIPVPGYGKLVKMQKMSADDIDRQTSGQDGVKIANWDEGGDALAQALGPLFEKFFTQMQAQQSTKAPPAAKTRKTGRKKTPPTEAARRLDILKKWERASGTISRKTFCADIGISEKELENYQRWAQQRQNRGQDLP